MKSNLCTLCLRGWRFHAKLVFTFNIFTGDFYFDALAIRLLDLPSYGPDPRRWYTLKGVCWCVKEVVGSLAWLASEWPGEEVYLRGLRLIGNYVCCLVIVVRITWLGGAKRWGKILKSSYLRQTIKGGDQFLSESWPL